MLPVKLNPFGINVKRLPYDREVEYLESTGTQWIDTVIAPDFNADFNILATASPLNNGRKVVIGNFTDGSSYEDNRAMYSVEFGGLSNNYPYCPRGWFKPSRQTSYSLWGDEVTPYAVVNIQISYSFTSNICKLIVNGVEYSQAISKQTVNAPRNLRMFRDFRIPTGIIDNGCSIYAAKVIISDSVVGNFIPVRTMLEGKRVGAMYDRANPNGGPNGNGMYYNQGSGDFIIGPDI